MSFTKRNYLLFGLGCLLMLCGFVLSAIGPYDGFLSLTLSPIVLGIAYLLVFPAAILLKSEGD